jgi:hypothetical protein
MIPDIREELAQLEVLSEIYKELAENSYKDKEQLDMAKLKMKLLKKEMLLLNYNINKELGK